MNCQFLPTDIISYCEKISSLTESSVFQDYGVFGLFINSLLSATALPIPTEILTTALLSGGENQFLVMLALALGSSVGGTINYVIGLGGNKLFNKIFKREKTEHVDRLGRLGRLGWIGIFFSPFIPIVGDLILISAGAKKMHFKKYMVIMIAGKSFKAIVTVLGIGALF